MVVLYHTMQEISYYNVLLYVLIDKQDLDLNVTDSKGRTALHWSAQYNRRDVTEVCLKHQQ